MKSGAWSNGSGAKALTAPEETQVQWPISKTSGSIAIVNLAPGNWVTFPPTFYGHQHSFAHTKAHSHMDARPPTHPLPTQMFKKEKLLLKTKSKEKVEERIEGSVT